jgi:tRNA G37 N-methylase TrmD
MIIFDIITIFPKIFNSFLKESFIKKAQEKGLIKIRIHNLGILPLTDIKQLMMTLRRWIGNGHKD